MNETPDCPRCKTPTVKRSGPKGFFFGCRNFPKCKYSTGKRFPNHAEYKDLNDNVVPGNFNTRKG
jgi:ssDNA-binding Zn-finger/Zn-ribbon topoisomerase 1